MSGPGGTIVIRRVVRKQEPRLLEDRANSSPVVGGRMNNISNQVVTGYSITTAPANKGVVTPMIHDLAAKSAVGVMGPNRHPETAT